MNDGWIKLHRSILDNQLWLSEPFTRMQAWIDILLLSNHKEGCFFVRGNKVKIYRGQIGISTRSMAKRWKWSRTKVLRFISDLESAHQLIPQKSNIITIHSIVNYELYQSKDTTKDTTDQTTEKPQKDPNKNNKKEKNIYIGDFDCVWKDYPAKTDRSLAEKAFHKHITTDKAFKKLRVALAAYKKHLSENPWKRPKNGATFINNYKDWIPSTEISWEEEMELARGNPKKIDELIKRRSAQNTAAKLG